MELRQHLDTSMGPLMSGFKQLSAQVASHQDSLKNLNNERRRLHNLVLELKGNIRVYCRIRPINQNELYDEPK